MNTVEALSGASNPANSSAAANRASVDYEAFLKLLVTQMKSQDPTNPMDSTDYIAQLASFSNVEQAIVTNTKLESVLSATMLSTAANLIGREVTGSNGDNGRIAQIRLQAGNPLAVLQDGREITLSGDWTLSE